MQPETIRTVAVDHHTQVVDVFEDYYQAMARGRFENAFTYGRNKVDLALDAEIQRLPAGASILDIGCGTGEYVRRYSARGYRVAGIEPSSGMRAAAIARNPGADIRDAVATSLPFGDAQFDLAFAIEVYRYLHRDDFRTSLKEITRVLKPGGRVFFTMVNRYALDGFYVLQRAREAALGGQSTEHPHCEFFSPRELFEEMEQARFSDIQVFGRMLGPLRLAYKIPKVGKAIAEKLDGVDDFVHRFRFATPFAGHLIAAATKTA